MKTVRVFFALILCALLLLSCSGKKSGDLRFTDSAMGKPFDVSASGDVEAAEFESLCREALERVKEVDRATDPADPLSDVARFNASEWGIDDAGGILQELLSAALYANELTGGAYDPTIGALTDLWSRATDGAPQDVRIEIALSHSGQEFVGISGESVTKVDEKLWLELDRVRGGFAAEEALHCIDNSALDGGSVTLGETTGFFGESEDGFAYTAHDHLARPFATARVNGGFVSRVINDFNAARGTSSIIDPMTGNAVAGDVRCAFVRSESGATSAAVAYALTVLPSKRGIELWQSCPLDFDALIVDADGNVYALGGFAADGAIDVTSPDYHLIRIKDK